MPSFLPLFPPLVHTVQLEWRIVRLTGCPEPRNTNKNQSSYYQIKTALNPIPTGIKVRRGSSHIVFFNVLLTKMQAKDNNNVRINILKSIFPRETKALYNGGDNPTKQLGGESSPSPFPFREEVLKYTTFPPAVNSILLLCKVIRPSRGSAVWKLKT